MSTEIIPFGKYKGQPIEVLKQDKQYLDWLQNQDWFKSQYGNINTLIINNFTEPSESPEHNKLCSLFLYTSTCEGFFNFLNSLGMISESGTERVVTNQSEIDEYNEHTQKYHDFNESQRYLMASERVENPIEWRPHVNPKYELKKVQYTYTVTKAVFENNSIDVTFSAYNTYKRYTFKIEVKPCVGDDYPAILRQMNNNTAEFLIAHTFSAAGSTLEEVKEIFNRSSKSFYLFSDFMDVKGLLK